MTPTEMIKVIKAYEEGNEIEMSDKNKNDWELAKVPLWNFAQLNYRIKPKEKIVYQYMYQNLMNNNYYATLGFYESEKKAQNSIDSICKIVQRLDYTKQAIKE
jgi:hypothetical protein